jgi:SAM-dependent methyltransferase
VTSIDFGKTAADYAKHRAGFPHRFFERLQVTGIAAAGMHALDLGTGTGTVARGLASLGCDVTGLDPSEALTAQAVELDRAAGVTVRYVTATAEDTGFEGESFDLVTAGQCWHWFDRPKAAAEVRRVLKPGGRLVIAHFDWIPLPGNVVHATEQLILKHNPNWALSGGNGVNGRWLADVATAGFGDIETASFDIDVPYSHEDWRGRIRASAGVAASLEPEAVTRFDEEHAAMLAQDFPQEPLLTLHRTWWVSSRKPG